MGWSLTPDEFRRLQAPDPECLSCRNENAPTGRTGQNKSGHYQTHSDPVYDPVAETENSGIIETHSQPVWGRWLAQNRGGRQEPEQTEQEKNDCLIYLAGR